MGIFPKLVTACLVLAIIGCGGPVSKVDQFKADQAATVTPHGRINLDSVSESNTGGINYQTQDGSSWKVQVGSSADGTARYNQPERQAK